MLLSARLKTTKYQSEAQGMERALSDSASGGYVLSFKPPMRRSLLAVVDACFLSWVRSQCSVAYLEFIFALEVV